MLYIVYLKVRVSLKIVRRVSGYMSNKHVAVPFKKIVRAAAAIRSLQLRESLGTMKSQYHTFTRMPPIVQP